jgi:3-phosphoglycerate kinase
MKTIESAPIENKDIIVKCDFNVDIKNGKISNIYRIEKTLRTIKYLKDKVDRLILISHLGRPSGKKDSNLSLLPVAEKLSEMISNNQKIEKTEIENFEAFLIYPKIYLLENIRFYPEEQQNDLEFSKKLSSLGDIFIFESFGTIDNLESSGIGLANILPTYAGFQVVDEIKNLESIKENPENPFTVVLGGAKIADKLPLLENLIHKADNFLIGGAIANTFLAAKEKEIGNSLIDKNLIEKASIITNSILSSYKKDIFLPIDFVVSKSIEKIQDVAIRNRQTILNDDIIVDIGPQTIALMIPKILNSKTIFWNGDMGIAEIEDFSQGTKSIAEAVAEADGKTIIAGGDTVNFLEKNKMLDKFDFISTGGGSALAYISGVDIPILEKLK